MTQKSMTSLQRLVQAEIEYSPKSYRRAATQRLDVATFLLKNSTYYLDAIYLAGYAAECSLKALILARTPIRKQAAACEEISSGAKSHNFDFLTSILIRKQLSIPKETIESLNAIKHEWITDLRYIGTLIPYEESRSFIKHVLFIHDWTGRCM